MTRWIVVFLTFILSGFLFFNDDESKKPEDTNTTAELKSAEPIQKIAKNANIAREVIAQSIAPTIKLNQPAAKVKLSDQSLVRDEVQIQYTFDPELQKESDSLLQRYKPDYGAIFMINAETGRVLAMSSFVKGNTKAENLNLKASFPAASVFKVITASAAVDRKGLDPDHRIAFNGGNYTLYKKNVLSEKITKWTRFISLKDAFARSINTAFGRLTLEALDPKDLTEYASRFMFNKNLETDFPVEASQALVPEEKGFELTQVASGYNRFNTMSPVHGAMIAASIVNDGKMMAPFIVSEMKTGSDIIYSAQPFEVGRPISEESSKKVREMMEQTVLAGTSRKSFRSMVRSKQFREVEMGGKTGHFSGTNPKGRNDWFVGFATDGENKVAIAAITVNVQKWTVKSSALAEMMFRKHFKSVLEVKELTKNDNEVTKRDNRRSKNQTRHKRGNDQTPVAYQRQHRF